MPSGVATKKEIEVEGFSGLTPTQQTWFLEAVKKHAVRLEKIKSIDCPSSFISFDPMRDNKGRIIGYFRANGHNFEIHVFYNKHGWSSKLEWDDQNPLLNAYLSDSV